MIFHKTFTIVSFSAAKAPFLVRFQARKYGVTELERICLEAYADVQGTPTKSSKLKQLPRSDDTQLYWQGAIFKVRRIWRGIFISRWVTMYDKIC
jgi:hypothetical protein